MATQASPQPMTAEEFWEAYQERPDHIDLRQHPEWANGYPDMELVDGVVVEGEVTNFRHQQTLHWIRVQLEPWVRARRGRCWTDGGWRLDACNVRGPDLMAWWHGQPVTATGMFTGIPDLVVEIISPRPRDVRRDREEKMAVYVRAGVPHYWLIEPIHHVFEAFLRVRPGPAQKNPPPWVYQRIHLVTAGRVEITGFKGLVLDLNALWRYVEGDET